MSTTVIRRPIYLTGGPQGPQGVQGIEGNQGVQGARGFQGERGFQGTKGDQGFQGVQGVKGEQGFQGIDGLQGNQGNQGFQGVMGPQGVQGSFGLTGDQGLQGQQGLQGIKGEQGFQGPIGIGTQGFQGTQGTPGVQGPQGNIGVGVQGVIGAQGPKGDKTRNTLANWREKLANSDNQLVRIAWVGDSLCWADASNYITNGFAPKVAQGIHENYTYGGSGFHGMFLSTLALPDDPHFAQFPVIVGAWIAHMNEYTGPGGLYAHTFETNATITWSDVYGTNIRVAFAQQDDIGGGYAGRKGGQFEVRVDSNLVMTVNSAIDYDNSVTSTTNRAYVLTVATGLSAGPHTVEIKHIDTDPNRDTSIFGIYGENDNGVVLHTYGRFGAPSFWFDNNRTIEESIYGQPGLYCGGYDNTYRGLPADLIVWALGVNDAALESDPDTDVPRTADQYETSLRSFLTGVYWNSLLTINPVLNPDILFVLPLLGRIDNDGVPFENIYEIDNKLAGYYNGEVVNLNGRFAQGWDYFNSLDGWSNDSAVHYSDAGATLYANEVLRTLLN